MKKLFLFALFIAGLMSTGWALGLFDKYANCQEVNGVSKTFSGLQGGPHYFASINHVCRPIQPEGLITDGRPPQSSDRPIYAAWFEGGRLVKLQLLKKGGEPVWTEENLYDRNGYLKSIQRTASGQATLREEYDAGTLVGVSRDGKAIELTGKTFLDYDW